MPIRDYQRIAMLGIGGSGMRGLAFILAEKGATIIGIDQALPILPAHPRITVQAEKAAEETIKSADLVIHTDAMSKNHSLLAAARSAGRPTLIYHEALGELSRQMRTLAVTGTHGKSSTTSMLAHIFIEAGFDPTALVGAGVPAWGGLNARVGQGELFIVEADEYRNHFLSLEVASAIITTIDFDHPDFFNSLSEVEASFSDFIQKISPAGVLVVPEGVVHRFTNIDWPATTRAISPPTTPINLALPGAHMQYNAWLAIQLASAFGIDEAAARAALQKYTGLGRRFELLGRIGRMDIVSDYGHHPAEIAATLAAARERYGPTARIFSIFEAHTEERLVQFFDAFADALAQADGVLLAPPFVPPGRGQEQSTLSDTLGQLAERLKNQGKDVYREKELSKIGHILTTVASQYELAVAFSAGQLDEILRTFVKQK